MTDTTATVTDQEIITATVYSGITTTTTDIQPNAVLQSLTDVGDVDTTTKINGSILVYKTTTNKWTSTTTLDAQNMEGGEF